MKKIKAIIFPVIISSILLSPLPAGAKAEERGPGCQHPYGGYCRGPRWGWYGANKPVTTEQEARMRFEQYFEGQNVMIGPITDKGLYFQTEIKDPTGVVVDQVIIDKRTGRIRSIN